ncbi:uncharacterized protein LOC112203423 [Rosa chinensis]|uniref:uncharacterized protein LOC112203423 n=1 Tax=Rosa chinensis TaxID=74649 RepID=UPI000D08C84C|nr:uncharacterized protein LOC112203423 [Rosa chinensis]
MYLQWCVWKERNKRVWEQKFSQASDVALGASTRLAEFRVHNGKAGNISRNASVIRWQRPSDGILKVNIDGAFLSTTRQGGLGFVIRDSNSSMLVGGAMPLRNLLSAEHAEILACQAAVRFVLDHNMMPAVIETDSLLVKQQAAINSSSNTSLLGRLYDDISEVLRSIPNVQIIHTRREANQVAHLLADHAKSLYREAFYVSAPSFLAAALAADAITM